jgi:hypothetical protein
VDGEPNRLEPEVIDELPDRACETTHRVVAVAILATATEPGQVQREAASPLEERQPVARMRRNAVHIDDRCIPGRAPEDRPVPDPLAMLVDRQRTVRPLIAWEAHDATLPDA